MSKTYMAIDQFNHTEHNLGPNPRQALMSRYGVKSAEPMYQDDKEGSAYHIGWIVAKHWFQVFEVTPMWVKR